MFSRLALQMKDSIKIQANSFNNSAKIWANLAEIAKIRPSTNNVIKFSIIDQVKFLQSIFDLFFFILISSPS